MHFFCKQLYVLDGDDIVVVGNDIVDSYKSYDSKEKWRKALVV